MDYIMSKLLADTPTSGWRLVLEGSLAVQPDLRTISKERRTPFLETLTGLTRLPLIPVDNLVNDVFPYDDFDNGKFASVWPCTLNKIGANSEA